MRLEPIYDGAKSFYNKANYFVSHDSNTNTITKELYSYTTLVAKIENGRAFVKGSYSRTTTRHIKEFLLQNGFNFKDTKDILNKYDWYRYQEQFNY